MTNFEQYVNKIHFDKYLKKINKKLANKKIIIYGVGSFFKYIQERYDLSLLNIIGVSDLKFKDDDEGQKYLNYNIIPLNRIISYNPDYVIVAAINYEKIIDNFETNIFYNTKIKVIPLARKSLWSLIKRIWED